MNVQKTAIKTPAVIIDIDHTFLDVSKRVEKFKLHDPNHAPEEFDWDKFFEPLHLDTVNNWCNNLAFLFNCGGRDIRPHDILFVTRRWEKIRNETEKQLENAGWVPGTNCYLYMADNTDERRSPDVKRDIFKEDIQPYFDVRLVIDDDRSVCEMYKYEFGIPSLNVLT